MRNTIGENDTEALDRLLEKVQRDTGHDFRDYKRGTITRRLERRLHAAGAKTYLEYMQFLEAHPGEYQRLTDYLTITVSSFFRSPGAFQQVAELVLPEVASNKRNRGEQSLKIWSTACAQGEEPYSIAILLTECPGNKPEDLDISIYATDVNRQALARAKAGIYSPQEVEHLPRAILESYFTRSDGGYIVNNDIRQMVSFSYFDLVSTATPPLVNLDLIFCCNILIYLQKQQQERVLNMLCDSLNAPGYLILGEVETPTSSLNAKLACLDIKAKIYKKNARGCLRCLKKELY